MDRQDLKPKILNEASNEIEHQYLSAQRARTELGWKPNFSLDDGLEKTIGWYQSFFGNRVVSNVQSGV